MVCRRYSLTNPEWLTGNSGSDQRSKLSGFAGWNRATTKKKWLLLESYEKLYLYLSLIFTTLSRFYSQHYWSGWWLSTGNITSIKSCAAEKLKLAAASFLRPMCNQTASGNSDEYDGCKYLKIWQMRRTPFRLLGFLSAHKVLELWLRTQAPGVNFWLMKFACVDRHTGRNRFLSQLRYHREFWLDGFVSGQLTKNE